MVTDGLGLDDTEIGMREFDPEGAGAGECGMSGVETDVGLKLVTLPTHTGHTDEVEVRVIVDIVL